MDNRIFNVNGYTPEGLLATLRLAFEQAGRRMAARAWYVGPKGLVLTWRPEALEGQNRFPTPLSADEVYPLVQSWLKGDEAKAIKLEGEDVDLDHDGHNVAGWRVFVEQWGHVGGDEYAICCITPAFAWMGK